MSIVTTANSKVSIGGTTPRADAAEYASETWVSIANITDVGEAGSSAEIVTAKLIDQAYVKKVKGSRDNGTMELVVARDSADAGYAALIAAEATPHSYNFCVELNDKPATGASPKNSKFYFNAIVASKRNSFSDADNIVSTTFSLAISGAIIEVGASAT